MCPTKHKFKKYLGQNFLMDKNILGKIITSIPKDYPILEVGTGDGALTKSLAEFTNKHIVSFEIDKESHLKAKANLKAYPNAELIHQDFLKAEIPFNEPFVIVANIPYYITSPLLEKFLEHPKVIDIYVMVQNELANRIIAVPSTKDYSSFSIFCQTRAKVKKLFLVSKNSFFPVPKVDSAFIRLSPITKYLKQIKDLNFYNKTIRSAFWGKRKTLLNCLQKSPYLQLEKEKLEKAYTSINLNLKIRGQQMKVEKFIALTNTYLN